MNPQSWASYLFPQRNKPAAQRPSSRERSQSNEAQELQDFSCGAEILRSRRSRNAVAPQSNHMQSPQMPSEVRSLTPLERHALFQRMAPNPKYCHAYEMTFLRASTDPRLWDKVVDNIRTGGIPDCVHGQLWMYLCGADKLRRENYGVYEQMLQIVDKPLDDVILRDVHRTTPNPEFAALLDDRMQQVLFRILRATAIKNREISYFQGMNNLAAMLLFYFVEEDAFWVLNCLLANQPYELGLLFRGGSELLYRYLKEFDSALKRCLPRVHQHLEQRGVFPIYYLTEWIATIFTYNVPFHACLWMWDMFFLQGRVFLFYGSLAILFSVQAVLVNDCGVDSILDYDTFEDLVTFIKKSGSRQVQRRDLIRALRSLHIPPDIASQLLNHFKDTKAPPDFGSLPPLTPRGQSGQQQRPSSDQKDAQRSIPANPLTTNAIQNTDSAVAQQSSAIQQIKREDHPVLSHPIQSQVCVVM